MKREITFDPAWDKRHANPSKNYGIHGCDMRMILKGKLGAVHFVIFTGWHLKTVREEFKKENKLQLLSEPIPADVGYHSPIRNNEWEAKRDKCEYLNNKPCYGDGSGLLANDMFEILVEKGSDGVWKELEKYYKQQFGKLE